MISPQEIRKRLPLNNTSAAFIQEARNKAADILHRKSKKIALLVGPCSIHDSDLAIEYALRLKKLIEQTQHFYIVMRVFLEKPRSHRGWKGLLYDPTLNGGNHIALGLETARKLLLKLAEMNVPCVTELLEPLALPYIEDLLTWGMIGARTSASQPHRQMASGLSFPVGFKNGVHGELDVAIHGILSAQDGHTYLSIDDAGFICSKQTQGNPLTHLVLRGSNTNTNYDQSSVAIAASSLLMTNVEPRILIDCSHGNSEKKHQLQARVFESVIHQIREGNHAIMGLMLESHLKAGKQEFGNNPLTYGVSITDSCIGWEETESLIHWADEELSPISMSSAQK
ncbi:MAG TPA: 3-deoxy-7-phosphoheptulonate synthase [Chlamydiales bacterium]|nr:3-deoxy-7-phosphoheptulonate synthase [Chlamydiales bacterium]